MPPDKGVAQGGGWTAAEGARERGSGEPRDVVCAHHFARGKLVGARAHAAGACGTRGITTVQMDYVASRPVSGGMPPAARFVFAVVLLGHVPAAASVFDCREVRTNSSTPCSGHGFCDARDGVCSCEAPWSGLNCGKRACALNCSLRGTCEEASGTCESRRSSLTRLVPRPLPRDPLLQCTIVPDFHCVRRRPLRRRLGRCPVRAPFVRPGFKRRGVQWAWLVRHAPAHVRVCRWLCWCGMLAPASIDVPEWKLLEHVPAGLARRRLQPPRLPIELQWARRVRCQRHMPMRRGLERRRVRSGHLPEQLRRARHLPAHGLVRMLQGFLWAGLLAPPLHGRVRREARARPLPRRRLPVHGRVVGLRVRPADLPIGLQRERAVQWRELQMPRGILRAGLRVRLSAQVLAAREVRRWQVCVRRRVAGRGLLG